MLYGAPPLPFSALHFRSRPVLVPAALSIGAVMEALRAAGRAVLRSPRLARHGLGLCRRRSECGPGAEGARGSVQGRGEGSTGMGPAGPGTKWGPWARSRAVAVAAGGLRPVWG